MTPHLRVARPTDNLKQIVAMYQDGLGVRLLGSFGDHEGFDGVMLGEEDAGYHLEFTQEHGHSVGKAPTQENLLVFYIPDHEDWERRCDRMISAGFRQVVSHNPYWDDRGATFEDLDGYRIVIQNASWK